MKIFRLMLFCVVLVLCLGQAKAQSVSTLTQSIAAYNKLLADTPVDQRDVAVGDMLFRRETIEAWRNHLQFRLDVAQGKITTGVAGAYDFSPGSSAWPNGVVPYVYETAGTNAMPAAKQLLFEAAIWEWQKSASLNFKPRTTEPNYILVRYTGEAANASMSSLVGMAEGGQVLNVAGWGNLLNCAHEIGHALGMIHEQCRPDRDSFVTINSENISPTAGAINFAIVPGAIVRTGYDFDSMMHYGRSFFARSNGLVTISVNAPNQIWSDGVGPQEIGQRRYLSAGDRGAMVAQYGAAKIISGQVKDASGAPLSGVSITLTTDGASYRGPNPVQTDAAGNYTFIGIPQNSGTYTLTPSQLGTSFTVASRQAAVLTADITNIDFTQTDSAPPGITIVAPEPSGIYQTISTASGTATDGGGVKEVRLALARTSDLVWWDWVNGVWGTTTFDWAKNVKLATGTANWTVALPTLANGGFQVHVQSVDLSDNASAWALRHFFVDPTPPTVSILQPTHLSSVNQFTLLRGTASDGTGSGISNNVVNFTLYQDGDFWTGFNWKSDTTAQDPEVLLTADIVGGEWLYNQLPEGSDARVGQYAVSAFVRDGATNTSSPSPGVTSVIFTVDRSAPVITIATPAAGSTLESLPTGAWFTGTATDNLGVTVLNLFIRRESDGLYWDGSGWTALSLPASAITSSLNSGNWQNSSTLPVPGATLLNGTYSFIAVGVDAAGNQTQTDSMITVDYHPEYVWTAGSYSDGNPNNDNHNWDNPANWSPGGVPGAQDRAIITGGQPYAGHLSKITVYDLELSGGSLSAQKLELTPGGTFTWSGGAIYIGNTSIPAGAAVKIFSTDSKYMGGGVLTNAGTVTWSGNGVLMGGNSARIDNAGLWAMTGDGTLAYDNSGNVVVFNNHTNGIVRKSVGTGNTTFHADYGGWQFHNWSQLDIQSGTLLLRQNTKVFYSGGSVTGTGRVKMEVGTWTLSGTTSLGAGSTVELADSTLTGTGGFEGTGKFEWSGGGINAGQVTVGTGALILMRGDSVRSIYGGSTFTNRGTMVANLTGTWVFSNSALFHNAGVMDCESDFTIYYDNGGNRPSFVNSGTLRRTTSSGAVVVHTDYGGTFFHNSGTVEVQTGSMAFGGGGTGGGTWSVASGKLIEFTGSTMTLTNGTVFSGAGTNRVNGGRVNFSHGANEKATVSGRFELMSGAWGGTGKFEGSGRLAWNAGTIDGNVEVRSGLNLDITGTGGKYISACVLTNAGTVNWSGDGVLTGGNSARIDNAGLWGMTGNGTLAYNNSGNVVVFNNHTNGIVRKSVGTGNTTFHSDYGGWQFHNWGQINVQTGVLLMQQGLRVFHDGGSVTGTGRVKVDAGTWTLNGTTSLGTGSTAELAASTITGSGGFSGTGTFEWSSGGINGAQVTVGAAATLLLSGSGDRSIYGGSTLTNHGTLRATLTGKWVFSNSALFHNAGVMDCESDFIIYYDNGGNRPSFLNSGTLRRTTSTGPVVLHTDFGGTFFHNSGTVEVQTGSMAFGGGGTGGGTWSVASGKLIEFTGSTMTLTNGTVFSGGGTNRVNGGRVNFSHGANEKATVSGRFELMSGAWGGTGKFEGNGRLAWNAGTIDGNVEVRSGLNLDITGTGGKYISACVLTNAGTVNWSGDGVLMGGNSARIDNAGLWAMTGDGTLAYNNSGNVVVFNNHTNGIVRKSVGTGNTTFHADYGGWQFHNWGQINVQTGVLLMQQGLRVFHDGGSVTGAGRVKMDAGTWTLNGTTSLGAGSTAELAAATITGSGGFSGTGTFEWSSGGINGAQVAVGSGARMLLSGAGARAIYSGAVLTCNGATTATLTGPWVLSSSAVVNNNGVMTCESDFTIAYDNGGNRPTFNNNATGTILKKTSPGELQLNGDYGGVAFLNAGKIEIQKGSLRINSVHANASTASTKLVLGGVAAGTGYGQINYGSTAQLDGGLNVVLADGFTPESGKVFDLVTFPGNSGVFVSPVLPALPSTLKWKLTYLTGSLRLEAIQAHALVNLQHLSGGRFGMDLSGTTATSVTLEASNDLIEWEPVETVQPFDGLHSFIDADAGSHPRRFYRIVIVE